MKRNSVHFLLSFVLISVFSFCKAQVKNIHKTQLLSDYPIITWLRKSPVEIGCMLEKEWKYRDAVFNCDYKNYKNNGDPCIHTEAYYEGLQIPDSLASKFHPNVQTVELSFEHGNLREIQINFLKPMLKTEVQKIFKLPKRKSLFPKNVIQIDYGENIISKDKPKNNKETLWLAIVGFDHIGAGDIDCK